jgi:hypothetical protein
VRSQQSVSPLFYPELVKITKHTLKNRLRPNTAANHPLMGAALLIPE